jgi:hypothetical protein
MQTLIEHSDIEHQHDLSVQNYITILYKFAILHFVND